MARFFSSRACSRSDLSLYFRPHVCFSDNTSGVRFSSVAFRWSLSFAQALFLRLWLHSVYSDVEQVFEKTRACGYNNSCTHGPHTTSEVCESATKKQLHTPGVHTISRRPQIQSSTHWQGTTRFSCCTLVILSLSVLPTLLPQGNFPA